MNNFVRRKMEMCLQTETGKRLHEILAHRMIQAPESVLDKLKRVFVGLSIDMENEDKFIAALYGQQVLDESPLILSQRVPTVFLRIQYGIENCLKKRCVKELVVAVERSKNDSVLLQLLSWAENHLTPGQDFTKSHELDLAPQKVQKKRLLSEIVAGKTLSPRHREIHWTGETKECSALEVCNNKIIVGWDNGQIKIYNSDDLRCRTVLNNYSSQSRATCLQCTCTELIAGYSNGNISVWNIENGIRMNTILPTNENGNPEGKVTAMRWRNPRLVAATHTGKVKIYQYANNSFSLLGSWDAGKNGVIRVDCNESFILLQPLRSTHLTTATRAIYVKYFDGTPFRSITSPGDYPCMALDGTNVVTGFGDRVLRIWDICTGICLKELEGHEDGILAVDAHNGIIASTDSSSRVIIWSAHAALLEGRNAKLASFTYPKSEPDGFRLKIGSNFVVARPRNWESRKLIVTDFLS